MKLCVVSERQELVTDVDTSWRALAEPISRLEEPKLAESLRIG